MERPAPRLVLAALRGGSGKTTVSLSLVAALKKRVAGVVPFKKGPDFIDAAWLSLAAEAPCYNLDTFLIGREQVVGSFSKRAPADSISVIEGNRGLYDGMNAEGEHSTAELAKLLSAPVVLVVDCEKVTRTTAAMVLGCIRLDPGVDIRGVILNRVGNARHAAIVRGAVEACCRVPVLGVVPRMNPESLPFPERHLGLVPPQEHDQARRLIARAGEIGESCLDLAALEAIARSAPGWTRQPAPGDVSMAGGADPGRVAIGVIRDRAFQFYYEENIETLREAGARIVEISALDDRTLPELDALYIGGGFPETQAAALAANDGFRGSLREAAAQGLPIYAECGGFIYLGESLTVAGRRYPMVGALPVSFVMEERPQGHGYTLLETDADNPFYAVGTSLRGHEFHYCRLLPGEAASERTVFQVRRGAGLDGSREGMTRNGILAGFTHIHALGTPQWAAALTGAAGRYRAARNRGLNRSRSRERHHNSK